MAKLILENYGANKISTKPHIFLTIGYALSQETKGPSKALAIDRVAAGTQSQPCPTQSDIKPI
jgi:hypothetical protein